MTKQTVELRPSRIRRDPLQTAQTVVKKSPRLSREQEIWLAITGIVLFAIAIAVVTLGLSALTNQDSAADAVAAAADKFGDCEDSAKCVIDGETIRIGGAPLKIAGMEAPRIKSPRCAEEKRAGVEAVGRLRDLLNSGKVTTGGEVVEPDGDVRTVVMVDGRDVGAAMVGAGVAREPRSVQGSWC